LDQKDRWSRRASLWRIGRRSDSRGKPSRDVALQYTARNGTIRRVYRSL